MPINIRGPTSSHKISEGTKFLGRDIAFMNSNSIYTTVIKGGLFASLMSMSQIGLLNIVARIN